MLSAKKLLVGSRPPGTSDALVVATPTAHTVRLNENTVSMLRVPYNAITSEDGVYVNAGNFDVPDADGNISERLLLFVVPKANLEEVGGAKLAVPGSKHSGSVNFSSAGVYYALRGNDTNQQVWKTAELYTEDAEGNPILVTEDMEVADDQPLYIALEWLEEREPENPGNKRKDGADGEGAGEKKAKKASKPAGEAAAPASKGEFGDLLG